MWLNFLPASAVAELGAWQVGYSRRFSIGASADGISASTVGSGPIPITGGLHFFTERLAISYPTVNHSESDVDDYVTRLSLQIATNTNLSLFTSPVPLQLIAVPGRQPTAGVNTGTGDQSAPGQPPHIPGWPWNSFIPQGTDFLHTFANISPVAAVVDVYWQGWNIPSDICPSEAAFWAIVKKHKSAITGT